MSSAPNDKHVTRENHFLPQWYLRHWSLDDLNVYAYRTLVSSNKVKEWEQRSIRKTAYLRDLYTTFADGKEVDEFERWITTEFEEPACEPVERVIHNEKLSSTDWDKLAVFMAAQDLRTPASLVESIQRWERTLPEMVDSVTKKALSEYEQAKRRGTELVLPLLKPNPLAEHFKIQLQRNDDGISIGTEVVLGRGLWLAQMKHLLTGAANKLKGHKWAIAVPKGRTEWFTSDHPVTKLNFNTLDDYNFKGGWGRKGTDLFLPISPRHLLFTEVGKDSPDWVRFSWEKTDLIQRMLAEHAHHWLFARKPIPEASKLRPRIVDPERFRAESEAAASWHENQRRLESE